MKSLKLAERRHSVRDYKSKHLSSDDLKTLNLILLDMPELPNSTGVDFFFIEDGDIYAPLLEKLAGYNGIMIHAPHYYVLLSDHSREDYMATGYIGEWFVLNALQNDISSCWLEVKDSDKVKSILHVDSSKEAIALLAIGYGKKEHKHSLLFSKANPDSLSSLTDMGYPNMIADYSQSPVSYRKPITELVYYKAWGVTPDINELEKMGLHEPLFYMRLAPSYENLQPWRFIIRDGYIELALKRPKELGEPILGVDAGIAMLYFEVGMHETGINGHWEPKNLDGSTDIPDDYVLMARYVFD